MAENDILERIAILEVKVENTDKTMEKLEKALHDNYSVTVQIKERLDKFNGAIPHLAEDVKDLKESHNKLAESLTNNKIEDTKSETKLKILWGAIGGAVAFAVSVAIKLLIGI